MLRTHHLVLSQAVAVAFRPSFSAVVIFSCNTFTPHKPLYTLKSLHQNINRTRLKASNVDEAYKALGIPLGSRKRDIKAAYYELMKQLHPDVNPDKDTTFEAAKLNLAYQYLLDSESIYIAVLMLCATGHMDLNRPGDLFPKKVHLLLACFLRCRCV